MKRIFVVLLFSVVACSYINGQGDAKEFAEKWAAVNYKDYPYNVDCAGRDTDGNGYIRCTVVVTQPDGGKEMVGLDCAVNRAGNGCDNEGCVPLVIQTGKSRQ